MALIGDLFMPYEASTTCLHTYKAIRRANTSAPHVNIVEISIAECQRAEEEYVYHDRGWTDIPDYRYLQLRSQTILSSCQGEIAISRL